MKKLAIIALLLVFSVLAGVQAQSGPSGELVVALPNDPTSLYGPNTADITATNAAAQLYDGLVWIDDEGNLVPALAESWEISEDGTEYVFTLRQGVTFHNGEVFNADSVVATWKYGKTPTNQYTDTYEQVSEVEIIDAYTVRLVTPEPNPLFLTELEGWWMIPPAYIAEVGIEGFEQAPVGTGPFVFVERTPGDRIVYEANPNYWQAGLPLLERVTFRIISDSTTRLAAIQTGEVDIVNRLSNEEAALAAASADVNILSYANDRVYYVAFKNIGNGEGTPLEDPIVRQALNYAVNRPGIVNALFNGEAELIAGFTLPSNLGYDDSIDPYPYDPDMARSLLAEAGYADGFSVAMGCPTDAYPSINEVCLSIQRDLSAVGIDVSVEFKTSNAYWSEPQYGAVGPMYVDSWSSSVGEALPRLIGSLIPGNYYNTWEDETITDYINRINTTIDRDARGALYAELQAYMYDNPPFIYLYALNLFEATSTRVEGYNPRANEGYFLKSVSVSS